MPYVVLMSCNNEMVIKFQTACNLFMKTIKELNIKKEPSLKFECNYKGFLNENLLNAKNNIL